MPRVPDSKALPPWWRRAVGGFRLGALALGGPWLLLVLLLVVGGRFQRVRSSEWDMLVLVFAYPLGSALAGLLLGLAMPLLRRPWAAVLAGFLATVPWFAAISIAAEPHDSTPYSVHWPVTLLLAACLGPVAGALAHDLIPEMRKRRERASKRVV